MSNPDKELETARRAFAHHAHEARQPRAGFWRLWDRKLEALIVGALAISFVVWALWKVFGG